MIPDILFHPHGKVVDETVNLIKDLPDENEGEEKLSSFFVEIKDEKIP